MEVSESEKREYAKRIMLSRMRLLCDNGFYGLLLMHIRMNIGEEHETAWSSCTNGEDRIFFNPGFLARISDRELDFCLSHLLLHIVLDHLGRKGNFEEEAFNRAADIIVNSNILRSHGDNESFITLKTHGGVQPHLAPDGQEGWKYTLEELCGMLMAARGVEGDEGSGDSEEEGDGSGNESGDSGEEGDGSGSESGDSGEGSGGSGNGRGSVGEGSGRNGGKSRDDRTSAGNNINKGKGWDYHNRNTPDATMEEPLRQLKTQEWQARLLQAAEAVRLRNTGKDRGLMPAFVERYLDALKKPQTDWRTVLDEFIQEEINDYSFCPPDRRFDDSPFFLPDFNEKDEHVEKILFMIDTSGSMSDEEIAMCYSEIKGAIDQFNGKLEGWLGFFDAAVIEPEPFVDEDEFLAIRPAGGGGTSFRIIFEYVREYMQEDLPVSIVILTDGCAPFPNEKEAMEIPVLWIIDNEKVTPPWGKVARIK